MKQYLYFFSIIFLVSFTNKLFGLSVKILSEHELHSFSILQSQINHTGTDACIRKVTDGKKIYILKQIHDSSLDEQFLLINDCIASTMGFAAGIHVNEVFFIPYNVGLQLKIYPERAATLHTCIAGNDLELKLPDLFSENFTLHQRVINPHSLWQKKFPLAEDQQGLTKDIIESMSLHDNLSPIVALDTFIGNSDRSLPNVFYDELTHDFYGIDHAAAFSKPLPGLAYGRLKELIDKNYFENAQKIIDSLDLYKTILLRLYQNNPPSLVMKNIHELVVYLDNNALHDNEIQERIAHHRFIIERNYVSTLHLITLLEICSR